MGSGNDLEIAPGFRASQWRALDLSDLTNTDHADWQKAILVFEKRIRSRFIDPVDALIEADKTRNPKTFGFAILAIDCLLIEVLEGFRRGITNHTGKSTELITDYLRSWKVFTSSIKAGDDPALLAKAFYSDVRCELHHAGATGSSIRIRATGPTFVFSGHGMEINRSALHEHLSAAFNGYLVELVNPNNSILRTAFRKKMAHLAR